MDKLCILNCTYVEAGIERLNKLFIKLFEKYNIDFEIYHLEDQIEDLSGYSHLIISGSALFASQQNENDKKIYEIIQEFANKSILGICYGHQMLAKALMKQNVCRRSKSPELGWRKVELTNNLLFAGISKPIFYESHIEEVFSLSDDFEIIASNKNCDIQGFQYNQLPIWGIQFHPEVNLEYSEQSIRNKLANNEAMREYFYNEQQYQNHNEQNFKIFKNFLSS